MIKVFIVLSALSLTACDRATVTHQKTTLIQADVEQSVSCSYKGYCYANRYNPHSEGYEYTHSYGSCEGRQQANVDRLVTKTVYSNDKIKYKDGIKINLILTECN